MPHSIAAAGRGASLRLRSWAGAPAYARLALAIGLAHFAWAVRVAVTHPGLRVEPDLVANQLYFDRLVAGDQSLARLWYFPLPKILLVALLGPLPDPAVVLAAAAAAAILAGSIALLFARAFGAVTAIAVAIVVALDPMWTALVATASADLFLAAAVAASVAGWTAGRGGAAAVALLLATLVKPPAAAGALPLLLDRSRGLRERAGVAGAVGLGLALTVAGYGACLEHPAASLRLPLAYAAIRGGAPPLGAAFYEYAVTRLGGDLLPGAWPLAIIGLVAAVRARRGKGVRQLLLAAASIATAYVAIAFSSRTFLFARFLWLAQVGLIASAVVGSIYVARAVARLGPLVQSATAAVLLLVVAGDLVAYARGAGGRYAREFDERARAALPYIDRLAEEIRPGERVDVPLWLQPIAIRRLGRGDRPESVEAAEVRVHEIQEGATGTIDADWVLFAPTYYETSEVKRNVGEAIRCGFEQVATLATPPLHLMHRDERVPCRSSWAGDPSDAGDRVRAAPAAGASIPAANERRAP